MELPFAVESPERTSQIMQSETAANSPGNDVDDGSSLVTTSSQGSFLGGSSSGEEAGGFGTIDLSSTVVTDSQPPAPPPQSMQQNAPRNPRQDHSSLPPQSQQQQQQQYGVQASSVPHRQPNLPSSSQRPQQQQQQQMLPPAPPAPPSTQTPNVRGITSGLNIFGNLRVPSYLHSSRKPNQQQNQPLPAQSAPAAVEIVDFTYVNVCESDADEVDISLDAYHTAMDGLHGTLGGGEAKTEENRRDILTILLSGTAQTDGSDNENLVLQCEEANQAACQALEAKKLGNLQGALDAHALSAKLFRDCAVLIRDRNANMANSLLLLSQVQAKSALSLKRIVKQQPANPGDNSSNTNDPRSKVVTQKDRLRAAVRGALVTRNEEDISDSAFLGKATKGPMTDSTPHSSAEMGSSTGSGYSPARTASNEAVPRGSTQTSATPQAQSNTNHNPVDDMMELERELKDMDMALELGNSIASLDARTQNRLKSSIVDGSFMVVPGSESYMSSSNMWAPAPSTSNRSANTSSRNNNNSIAKQNQASQARAAAGANAGAQNARKNRVQNLLQASVSNPTAAGGGRMPHQGTQQHAPHTQHHQAQQLVSKPASHPAPSPGLESSWWGSSSTTSHVLTSSVISLGASTVLGGVEGDQSVTSGVGDAGSQPAANTKQLMRLMDALKTLGDENANLLREVEGAESARMEAKAAREQMAKFKAEYGKRFHTLKAALEKFRKGYPENTPANGSEPNPVTQSTFMQSASATEQLQRQEQLIRKLTADLKKEKEESKKKDAALRKYESFYREVKARSAQKAAQRQKEAAGAGRPPQPRPGQR